MTHLQHAQPVTFGHWLLAHVQPLLRDLDRLRDWDDARPRSARSAPARWPARRCRWTRCAVAKELGFTAAAANSMDAVADRDFVAEFLFVTALIGVHLSRLGEEVVLWTSHGVRLGRAGRRVRHRLVDHAAEEERGHRRAGPGQVRPAHRRPGRAC